MDIYVSNLGKDITDDSLEALFSTYARVNSLKIVSSTETGNLNPVAFLNIPDHNEAVFAIKKIDGTVVGGNIISVKNSKVI